MKLNILSLILLFTAISTLAQDSSIKPETRECQITDPWLIQYTPVSFLGLMDAPVKIVAVSDSGLKEKAIGEVEVKNLSDNVITAVKIKWFLYRVDRINGVLTPRANPKIIMQRESPNIKTGELRQDEKKYIIYPMGQCQEIYDALIKDGDTEGEPWIEPSVSEILYSDGSKWTR